jgi:Leucine-rich repeat (LRR) protein
MTCPLCYDLLCAPPSLPPLQFWAHQTSLTSLIWREVHTSAPPGGRGWRWGPHAPLPPAAAAVLPTLRALRLEYCGLGAPPAEVLAAATALTELSLEGNWFDPGPAAAVGVGAPPRLERLCLDNCGLRAVPGDVGMLSVLRELSLARNRGLRVRAGELPRGLRRLRMSSGEGVSRGRPGDGGWGTREAEVEVDDALGRMWAPA